MTTYKTEVFSYIAQNKDQIENIANQIGISKEALAGAIADAFNDFFVSRFREDSNLDETFAVNLNISQTANYHGYQMDITNDGLVNNFTDDGGEPYSENIEYYEISLADFSDLDNFFDKLVGNMLSIS